MRNRMLAIDVAIAVLATIVLVIVAPGLAIVGLVAVIVLIGCGVSYLVDRIRAGRRRPLSARERSAARRSPGRG